MHTIDYKTTLEIKKMIISSIIDSPVFNDLTHRMFIDSFNYPSFYFATSNSDNDHSSINVSFNTDKMDINRIIDIINNSKSKVISTYIINPEMADILIIHDTSVNKRAFCILKDTINNMNEVDITKFIIMLDTIFPTYNITSNKYNNQPVKDNLVTFSITLF